MLRRGGETGTAGPRRSFGAGAQAPFPRGMEKHYGIREKRILPPQVLLPGACRWSETRTGIFSVLFGIGALENTIRNASAAERPPNVEPVRSAEWKLRSPALAAAVLAGGGFIWRQTGAAGAAGSENRRARDAEWRRMPWGCDPAPDGQSVMYTWRSRRHCVRLKKFLDAHHIPCHLVYVDEFKGAERAALMGRVRAEPVRFFSYPGVARRTRGGGVPGARDQGCLRFARVRLEHFHIEMLCRLREQAAAAKA